jgi:hypothetical protein
LAISLSFITHLSTCNFARTSNERKVGKVAHQERGALQLRPLRWKKDKKLTPNGKC